MVRLKYIQLWVNAEISTHIFVFYTSYNQLAPCMLGSVFCQSFVFFIYTYLRDLLLWLTPFSFPHSPVTQIFLVSSLSVSFVQKNKDVLAMFKLPMPLLSTKVNLLQITFPLQNLPPFSYLETLRSFYF